MNCRVTHIASWPLVWIAFAAGLAGAFHMGKVPTALPYIRSDLSLTLWQSGLVVSSFSLIAAVSGLVMGILSSRIGMITAGTTGLLLTSAGALSGSLANDFVPLLATRVLEGLGFVLIAVTMPGLISVVSPPRQRALALGIWGAFIPAAMSLMLLISPDFLTEGNWQNLWIFTGTVCILWSAVFLSGFRAVRFSLHPDEPVANTRKTILGRGPLLLAATFICYSALFAAMTGFLPTIWSESKQVDVATTSRLGAIAVAGNIAGNVFSGWLYGRGVPLKRLLYIAILGGSFSAALVFVAQIPLWIQFVAMVSFATLSGMLPGAVFASAPEFAAKPAQISYIVGMVFQGAGIGQVSGPLLLSGIVSNTGSWSSGLGFILIIAAAGTVFIKMLPQTHR